MNLLVYHQRYNKFEERFLASEVCIPVQVADLQNIKLVAIADQIKTPTLNTTSIVDSLQNDSFKMLVIVVITNINHMPSK